MADLPRYAVGALWCLVVGSFVLELRAGRRGAGLGLFAAAMLAGCAFFRWHVDLLRDVRGLLRAEGEYDDRVAYKVGVGALAALLLAVFAWRASGGERQVARGALVATLGGLAYLSMQTAFLDDVLPEVLAAGPGRYGVEAVFALLALVLLARARRAE